MHEQRKRSTSAMLAISVASEAARLAARIRSKSTQYITFHKPDKKIAAEPIRELVVSVGEEEKHEVVHADQLESIHKIQSVSHEAQQIDHEKEKAKQPIPLSHKAKNNFELLRHGEGDGDSNDEQNEPVKLCSMDASIPSPLSISEPSLAIVPNGSFTFKKSESIGSGGLGAEIRENAIEMKPSVNQQPFIEKGHSNKSDNKQEEHMVLRAAKIIRSNDSFAAIKFQLESESSVNVSQNNRAKIELEAYQREVLSLEQMRYE